MGTFRTSPRMTVRSRERNYVSSEAPQFYQSEYNYWPPTQVDYWDQSVQSFETSSFGDYSVSTSPDIQSECPSLDLQDISSLTLSPSSSPTDWSELPHMDNSTCLQSPENDWSLVGLPVTTQSLEPLDTNAWLAASHPSVVSVSPAPTHESQSSRTFNSVSEQDGQAFLPNLEFSLTAEPAWDEFLMGTHPHVSSPPPQFGFPAYDQSGLSGVCTSSPVAMYPGSVPFQFVPQAGQDGYSRGIPNAHVTLMRPLLPRTESSDIANQPAYGEQRHLLPNLPGSHRSQPSARSVSTTVSLPREASASGLSAMAVSSQPASVLSTRPGTLFPSVADPAAEEFQAYISFDQEDHVALETASRRPYRHHTPGGTPFAPGYDGFSADPASFQMERKPTLNGFHSDSDGQKVTPTTQSLDADEGRHRSHEDYSRPPHTDGLYYCPYKATEKCSHKPTKLKCNYDKYIDSHVKPFRCKVDACSKLDFSSTACLLRHEREAHGMHGHGDRPHLCIYGGCERGAPGNGFPRRYNLFDHMKRVHDHKEDAVDASGNPILVGETQKRIKGAKRKPSSPLVSEPAVQRQKTMAMSQQCQAVPIPPEAYRHVHGYFPPPVYGPRPYHQPREKQRMPFAQWSAN